MKSSGKMNWKQILAVVGLMVLLSGLVLGQPVPAATAGYNSYIEKVETAVAGRHRSASGFLAVVGGGDADARLRRGELILEELTPTNGPVFPGAMLHHWRATAFVPGATVAGLERLMKDYAAYSKVYAPQVVWAKVTGGQGDHIQVLMRVRQKHVITVVMDTGYGVEFGRLDAAHGYSASRSTKISEIGDPGTKQEHVLSASEEHGFLWRQNTYWSYEEKDGGLYMQIESVSMSRSIPTGLGWAVKPFVESVPRESLEFTLQSTCNALKKQ